VWRSNIFTTHTPVPAGNEFFDISLVRPYLESILNPHGIDVSRVLNWGMPPLQNDVHELSMTILGLRMANFSNGVSRLHGEVARKMWKDLWPGRPIDEIPIGHITNGVHIASWISERNKLLFDHYLSPGWMETQCSKRHKIMVDNIPDEELWHTHEM
jgi:starch phosphorylase